MTHSSFHPALRLLHWLMAFLVLSMLFIGVGMVSTAGPLYPILLAVHRPIGLALLLLALLRLAIRLCTRAPEPDQALPRSIRRAARLSHILLYAFMFALPLLGWTMLSAGGYPVVLAKGYVLPPIWAHDLAAFARLRSAHGILALLFFALILGHIGAALVHALIRRDDVMRSMGFALSRRGAPLARNDEDSRVEAEEDAAEAHPPQDDAGAGAASTAN